MNESITEHGLFWINGQEQKRAWGTILINEINEVRLETFGSLIGTKIEDTQTIVGLIKGGQRPVTLLNCFPLRTEYPQRTRDEVFDWSHQTCLVNGMLDGLALEDNQEPAFVKATIDISTLTKWVGPNLVNLEFGEGPSGNLKVGISVNDRADETLVTIFRGKEIKITIESSPATNWTIKDRTIRYSIEDDCSLTLEKADGSKLHLQDIISVTAAMQDLLSVCCNETSVITGLRVKQEQGDETSAKVFLRMKGYKVARRDDDAYWSLNFDDIGRTEGIARWLQITEEYNPSVAHLTSHWYNDIAYGSDKLSRTYTAVEALIARKLKHPQANMNVNELGNFVNEAIPGFRNATGTTAEAWADKVKTIRDKTIDHLDPRGGPTTDGLALFQMADVLYVAGAVFLLRESGIEEPGIEKYIHGCYQSRLLR